MRVITRINKIDLIRFNMAMLPRMGSTYTTVLWIATLAFGFICWKSGFPQTASNWVAIIFSSVCGGVVGMLFGVAFSVISILFMSSEKNGILGEHEYTISPDGLLEKTSANQGLSKWQGISKVKVVGSYLLFQISGYLFHIVPVRSFSSKKEFDDYAALSMAYWQSAQSKGTA